jgi:hypothetical protein
LDEIFDKHPDIDNVIHFAALKVSMRERLAMEEYTHTKVFRL